MIIMEKFDAEIFDGFLAYITSNNYMIDFWVFVVKPSVSALAVHQSKDLSQLCRYERKSD